MSSSSAFFLSDQGFTIHPKDLKELTQNFPHGFVTMLKCASDKLHFEFENVHQFDCITRRNQLEEGLQNGGKCATYKKAISR